MDNPYSIVAPVRRPLSPLARGYVVLAITVIATAAFFWSTFRLVGWVIDVNEGCAHLREPSNCHVKRTAREAGAR